MKSLKKAALALGSLAIAISIGSQVYLKNQTSSNDITTLLPAPTSAGSSLSMTNAISTASSVPQKTRVNSAADEHELAVVDGSALQLRIDQMQARRIGMRFNPDEVKSAIAQPSAWQTDPSVADNLPLDQAERYDGREFIRFSPMKLESLIPGDEMEIPLAQQNATYQMVVDSVQVHPDGNVSWYGHLKDFPEENQVSFTRGQDLTVGSIAVPDKQFTLQAQNDIGWVVNSFVLFKGKDEHMFPEESDHGGHDHSDHQHSHDHKS